MKSCLYPECQSPVVSRGLCNAHYQAAIVLVKRGKATWEYLEKNRKCLPRRNAKDRSWFLGIKAAYDDAWNECLKKVDTTNHA